MKNEDYLFKDLTFIDAIKSIAVIGASKKRGYFFLRTFYDTFDGTLFAINPGLEHIEQMPEVEVYGSIKDIPESKQVDFAFITVPREIVPKIITECKLKGVKLVAIFTAEFADAGTMIGVKLQKEIIENADDKVRILGPNGMGLYYPERGIRWRSSLPIKSGNIGIVAQSGGLCNLMIHGLTARGLGISKALSIGNAADVNLLDSLNYFIQDNQTELIIAYIEGIPEKTGRILIELIKNSHKPLIILKGGRTNVGALAASSHTASLIGNSQIWDVALNHTGAIKVTTITDLFNLAEFLKCYSGKKNLGRIDNICVASLSGGFGVLCADLLTEYGFNLPSLAQDTNLMHTLDELFTAKGTNNENPLDLAVTIYQPETVGKIFNAVLSSSLVDALVFEIAPLYLAHSMRGNIDLSVELSNQLKTLRNEFDKPIICIVQEIGFEEEEKRMKNLLLDGNIPVYSDILDVARFLKHFIS